MGSFMPRPNLWDLVPFLLARWLRRLAAWGLLGWLTVKLARWFLWPPARAVLTLAAVGGTVRWGIWGGFWSLTLAALGEAAAWVVWYASRGTATGAWTILSRLSSMVRLRRVMPDVMADVGWHAKGDRHATPPTRHWTITERGVDVEVLTGAIGQPERDAIKHTAALQAATYLPRVRVERISSGIVRVHCEMWEFLAAPITVHEIPPAEHPGVLSLGMTEDGGPLEIPSDTSLLIGALPGAGKSGTLWAYIHAAITEARRDGAELRLWVYDPLGVEFSIMRPADRDGSSDLAIGNWRGEGIVHRYCDAHGGKVQERQHREHGFWHEMMSEYRASLKASPPGLRKAPPGSVRNIVIVDELLPLSGEVRKMGADHPLTLVASGGRKVGWVVVVASQDCTKEVLGPFRGVIANRLAGKTEGADMTNVILGDGAAQRGAGCHHLDPLDDRGVMFASLGRGIVASRIGWVTDDETAELAAGRLPVPALSLDPGRPRWVYWLRNWSGEVIYVGSTNDTGMRMRQHARTQPWWSEVDESQTVFEQEPDQASGFTTERLEIGKYGPHGLYNEQWNSHPKRIFVAAGETVPW